MKRSILKLEACTTSGHANTFRTIIKTKHSRMLFLLLEVNYTDCTILDCFYIDRNQSKTGTERYCSKPLKLQTFQFKTNNLLYVIETELDKKFYSMEFVQTEQSAFSIEQYIQFKTENKKYHFLIMVGEGEIYNGLPIRLRTRLKNKFHRSIYVELMYYKEGNGVVQQCYYYDRKYKREDIKITPRQLISCFFPYNHNGILNLINNEICCDFTHMIITNEIDLDSNTMPLCGAV